MKTIRNSDDHERALKRVEELWGAELNSDKGDELEELVDLIEGYEEKHFLIDRPKSLSTHKRNS